MARSPSSRASGPAGLFAASSSARHAAAAELAKVRAQLREAQETIEAIRSGGVDSLVIGTRGEEQVIALATADRLYRLIIEAMSEGAASVSPRGVILDANPRLCEMTGRTASELVGSPALDLSTEDGRGTFARLLDVEAGGSVRGEAELTGPGGTAVPVLLATSGFDLDGMLVRCLVLTDLTAQRAAESEVAQAHQALREQSAFLKQAQASAGLGWWTAELGPGGRFTASPKTFQIAGIDPAEFDGMTASFRSLLHPDDAQKISDATAAALEDGAPVQLEFRIIRPDGAVRWMLQSAVVDRDDAGAPTRMLGICQDITDRKRIEDEIRAASAYNRSLIEASLDPMMTVDADGRITDLNGAALDASGYARAEVIGTDFSRYFTEPEAARAGYQQVLREENIRDFPLELRHRDGRTTPLLCSASVFRDTSGRTLGILASGHDITQIKRTEAELRESRERLSMLFHHAPVGIDELAPDGSIVRANPRFCEITGYAADELRSMRVQDLIHPDDLAADLANVQRLLHGEIGQYSMERRFLRKDGGVVWAEVNRAVVRDDEGAPQLIVGAVRDITAQRQAEADVRAAAAYNRSLLEASLDPLVTIGEDGKITDVNTAAEHATGHGRNELVGTEFSSYFTEPDRAKASYEQVFRDGAVRDYPLELRHRDEHTTPVLYNASVYRDPSGRVLGVFAAARDVTQIRHAQAALRQSEERLRAIFDHAMTGIAEIAPSGEILRANSYLCQIVGYTADELRSMHVQDVVHPDDRDADLGGLRRLLSGEIDNYSVEKRYLRKDGATVWAEVSRALVRDESGNALIVGTVRDITAQHHAEAEVRAAAAYNRSLLEASLDPLVTIGEDGKITDANAATEQATGYERAELIGTDFCGYFTDTDQARSSYEQVFRDGSVRDYPLEVRHRDGHTTPVLYNATVYRDQSGQVLGVFAAARDITQIRRSEAALAESRERLRALVDNAPVGIDDLTPDGEFVRVNPRFCQITGYTADELRTLRIQDIIHPDDRDADRVVLQRLVSGEIDSDTMERRFVRKGGGVIWAEVNRALVRDDSGEPLLIVGAVRDTTAQRQAEAEVRALNAELGVRVAERTADLARANKNLEAFTYSVSHDLRAPLRALSGFSQALVEEYSDMLGETGRGYAGRIQAASERMARLIDDLLQLSRVSRADMSLRPVDLSAEVADVAEELRARDPGRRIRFAVQDDVWVNADRPLIRSVVQNLVENALKFTARRDDAAIEFGTAAADDGRVCCFVRDNGAGFDPAYVGKLFQPFQRLHSAADFPGTGIGLASVQRIIERHGGRVWAEGAVDQGATFYFTIEGASPPATSVGGGGEHQQDH